MTGTARILLFGATGQIGDALKKCCAMRGDIVLTALSRADADFRFPKQVVRAIRQQGPFDMVVNAAAYTAVDKAENDEAIAQCINADTPGALAETCASLAIPLVHLSTDYVFDGETSGPYRETDTPNPLSAYGRSKLGGEEAIRQAGGPHVILRTSWVYGAHGTNFMKTMLRLAAGEETLRVVDDQYGAPTAAIDVAAAILHVAGRIATGKAEELFGTFHYSAKGETTWRGFAEAIFEEAGTKKPVRIIPIRASEYRSAARRPSNSRLDCKKIETVYGVVRPYWRASLARVMAGMTRHSGGDNE